MAAQIVEKGKYIQLNSKCELWMAAQIVKITLVPGILPLLSGMAPLLFGKRANGNYLAE